MVQAETAQPQPKKRRFTLRLFHVGILVVIVALLAGIVMMRQAAARKAAQSGVRTVKATTGTIVQTISSTGIITAETGADVKIGSQISGRIRQLNADIGTVVAPNQVIAEIDAPDLQANLDGARRNADNAQQKYQQQLEGVGMTHTTYASAYQQASNAILHAGSQATSSRAALSSARSRLKSAQSAEVGVAARLRDAEAKLRAAQANLTFQSSQTGTDVQKAKAALASAQSSLAQTQKNTDLEVANAQAALKQAQSGASLAAINLKRQQSLLAKGYAAQADVDTAQTNAEVTTQQVGSAQANLDLVKAKVAADLPVAQDAVEQAKAALVAAQSETNQETMRTEDIRSAEANRDDARAAVDQAHQTTLAAQGDVEAALAGTHSADLDIQSARSAQQAALGNMTNDKLKQRDVAATFEAYRQAQAQVAFQEAQFAKSSIRTPIGGTVVTLSQQQGETISAGLSAPVLVEVVDLDRLEVNAYVDETDIGQVHLKQDAVVTVDAYPDKKFEGQVLKIASAATLQNNVVTYLVTIRLTPGSIKGFILKPQMTTDVQIYVQKRENVVLAPSEAVKQRRGASQVVVMRDDGKPEVRDIKTGLTDSDNTEILSGLKDGEVLIVSGFDKLGLKGFSSAAEVPGFLTRTPFGTSSGAKSSTPAGQAPAGGSGGAGGGGGKSRGGGGGKGG